MVEMGLCLVLIYLRLCVSWLYTSFKWEHCLAPLSHSNDIFVLFCVEMSVYLQHFSVHVKADRNKPRRQRLCQSGWIIVKWSWCTYSSFQNLQNKPLFPFPAFKRCREIYFQPFQPDTLLLVLGSHLWPSFSQLQLIHAWRPSSSTAFPPFLTAELNTFSFSPFLTASYTHNWTEPMLSNKLQVNLCKCSYSHLTD